MAVDDPGALFDMSGILVLFLSCGYDLKTLPSLITKL